MNFILLKLVDVFLLLLNHSIFLLAIIMFNVMSAQHRDVDVTDEKQHSVAGPENQNVEQEIEAEEISIQASLGEAATGEVGGAAE